MEKIVYVSTNQRQLRIFQILTNKYIGDRSVSICKSRSPLAGVLLIFFLQFLEAVISYQGVEGKRLDFRTPFCDERLIIT